jgi:hypothetical protein
MLLCIFLLGGATGCAGSAEHSSGAIEPSQSLSDITRSLDCDAAAEAPSPSRPLVVALKATRVTGPAPLPVLFDASCTRTHDKQAHPFHQVRYEFDFGDDRGQTWPVSGLSRNVQKGGALAAHVFDNPGTYQVRVSALDPSGARSESSITVTVQDPDKVFSGGRTLCVSRGRDFAGCPGGSAQQTSLPSSYDNRRILLRRGESFGAISIPHGAKNVQIGAFGPAGAKPNVERIHIGTISPNSSAFPSGISVMDLSVAGGIEQYVTVSRLLLYRNEVGSQGTGLIAQINLASALGYIVQNHRLAAEQYHQPREIFVVENRVHGTTSSPIVNMVGEGSRFVIMGNDMGTAQQHTVRIYAMHKGVIAHNALRGRSSDGVRVALKLHSGGLDEYNDNYALSRNGWATRQVVIANNRLGDSDDNNSFIGGASPENNTTQSRQGLEDVILENNVFVRGPKTNTEFILMGRRMTSRGNLRLDGGPPNINQFNNSYERLPADWNGPYFTQ